MNETLDAQVAEKVMGILLMPHGDRAMVDEKPKPYSTELTVAWEVVERMKELGFAMGLTSDCFAWFLDSDGEEVARAQEDMPAEAICRAALQAVGG